MPETNPTYYTRTPEQETRGTVIGRQREVAPVVLDPMVWTPLVESLPIERVTAPTLGDASLVEAAQLRQAGDAQFREKQVALLDALERRARGEGPSLADIQTKAAFDRIAANQQGAMASARGNPALAMRNNAIQAGDLQQQAAIAALTAKLQERYAAEQQLADVSASGRAQDYQRDVADAQLEQQARAINADTQNVRDLQQAELTFRGDLSNQQYQNQAQASQEARSQTVNLTNAQGLNSRSMIQAQMINDAITRNQSAVNSRLTQNANIAGGIQQSTLAAEAQKAAAAQAANATIQAATINADASTFNTLVNALVNSGGDQGQLQAAGEQQSSTNQNNTANNNTAITGAAINAGGSAAASYYGGRGTDVSRVYSDETLKKDVSAAGDKTKAMLDALKAKEFSYKSRTHGKGKHTGVMAQDLEKSELGREMVVDGEDGKQIDLKRGMMAILAAQAELNKRLKAVEGRA